MRCVASTLLGLAALGPSGYSSSWDLFEGTTGEGALFLAQAFVTPLPARQAPLSFEARRGSLRFSGAAVESGGRARGTGSGWRKRSRAQLEQRLSGSVRGGYHQDGDGESERDGENEERTSSSSSGGGGSADSSSSRLTGGVAVKAAGRWVPSPEASPMAVGRRVLRATQEGNFGAAIGACSKTNPARRFNAAQMQAYVNDPALPFYHVLGEWDEMEIREGPEMESDSAREGGGGVDHDSSDSWLRLGQRAVQRVCVKRSEDRAWSTVVFTLVLEEKGPTGTAAEQAGGAAAPEAAAWRVEGLWVDDGSSRASAGRPPAPSPLFEEHEEEPDLGFVDVSLHSPAYLLSLIKEEPAHELSPKRSAFNTLLALRLNDIPFSNHGTEVAIRFSAPSNPASTLTPAHFAKYLREEHYSIIAEWEDLMFHDEERNASDTEARLLLLLRCKGANDGSGEGWKQVKRPSGRSSRGGGWGREDRLVRPPSSSAPPEWKSVSWDMRKVEGLWLTDKIWVDDA